VSVFSDKNDIEHCLAYFVTVQPDYEEAQDDRKTALRLVKKRKQLHSSGLSDIQNRYTVGDKNESS
jgi:hypothetical protein